MTKYKTLYGEEFEINSLLPEHKATYLDIKGFYDKKPEWSIFGNYWHEKVDSLFKPKTKREREKVTESTLWRIAEDLESRLGIEQGCVRPTDDTDRLFAAIIKEFGYNRKVWKKAENIIKSFDKLGYEIKLKKIDKRKGRIERRCAPVAIKFDEKDEARGLDLLIKNLQAPVVGLAKGVFVIEKDFLKIFDDARISYKTVNLEK